VWECGMCGANIIFGGCARSRLTLNKLHPLASVAPWCLILGVPLSTLPSPRLTECCMRCEDGRKDKGRVV
jgi:hypothetical protein